MASSDLQGKRDFLGETTVLGNLTVNGYSTKKDRVISLTASDARTLTADESGSIVFIPSTTTSCSVTLPAVAEGLNFRFILTAAADGTHTRTISGATTGKLNGFYTGVVAAPVMVSFTAKDSLILGATAANTKVGDYADFYCNGSAWYIRASTNGTASGWTAP